MKKNVQFEFIASTPAGIPDPSIAIAASRAGAIGILDLEYIVNNETALKALKKVAQYAKVPCGVKLDSEESALIKEITPHFSNIIRYIILTSAKPEILRNLIEAFSGSEVKIYLQATRIEHAWTAVKAGVHGIVAKGSEAGGRVDEETSFILLQRILSEVSLPVWVHGGIGLHTVAACRVAGAAGVVLDSQLLLTRESSLSEKIKSTISNLDGSETTCIGEDLDAIYRIYSRPDLPVIRHLNETYTKITRSRKPLSEKQKIWRNEIRKKVAWENPDQDLLFIGQDAAFAQTLADRYYTVGGVVEGYRRALDSHLETSCRLQPLAENSALAGSHKTRYPIVQGPMTRVSDTAAFAEKVSKGGGLPMLALAMMRAPAVRELLQETRDLLGSRSWGVGILGFVPLELREEQLEVIREYRPPFAIIAGGRPDQARTLEKDGIATYLHVPSPGLLKMFLKEGARRFIFEGRECGGHVGPRSSFVLWNMMVQILMDTLSAEGMQDCHVLFAGGIHDALSSSMVSTIAAPLAERGAKIGALLGTGYLFTREATTTGAILPGFQEKAIECSQTVLLESGPGHATRCADSPYVKKFNQQKRLLSQKVFSAEDIRTRLEELNLGRLRIASKGTKRNAENSSGQKLISVDKKAQHSQGMYMIGQLAALKNKICTIEQLHQEVAVKGSERLVKLALNKKKSLTLKRKEKPSDIAIIGMSCLLPKAGDLQTYWENILNKVDAITEVPKDRWDWQLYFDADPKARDKVYSKWGGFLDAVPFDPMRYGMPPNTLPSIEPMQLLTLEVVRQALADAGYRDRLFARENTSVIIGVGGGAGDLGQQYALRSGLPMFVENPSSDVWERLPEWTEDSFAGILANVVAGRVANRFNLGGVNYTVDAACASSLAAVYLATRELENNTSDMVIVGGADTVQNPFGYLCFSKTHALSPRGRCRTFDQSADGIVISEGFAMLVLKRLADAERDGDRIYGVIKAVAGSSDGRDKGLTAPRPEGQARALNRAYDKANFSPITVGLVEAHGTGTVVGDKAEVETLKQVFQKAGVSGKSCAIGSVKSMIGHTKCTAGVAGLIKITKALHHKVLPPTLHVEKPNTILKDSPFYVNTEARPWIHGSSYPRRAGVSAFGFGGTNFHAVVEEYTGDFLNNNRKAAANQWPCELFIWKANSKQEIVDRLISLRQNLVQGARPDLRDLAFTLWRDSKQEAQLTLAIVATSLKDLQTKLHSAESALSDKKRNQIEDPSGIYFFEKPLAKQGKVAFLFPGQGSQYLNMISEMAVHFGEIREAFEAADRVLAGRLSGALSSYVYPASSFSPDETRQKQQALTQTNIAQPALGAAEIGLFNLVQNLGIKPEMAAGHSYGEYVALWAANIFEDETLYRLSEARGRCIMDSSKNKDLGTMAAVQTDPKTVSALIEAIHEVWIANHNAPQQTIISGTQSGVEKAIEVFAQENIPANKIDVACAFHSPIIAAARDNLAKLLSPVSFNKPELPVFSNTTAKRYTANPEKIASHLSEHLVKPVEFVNEIEAIYDEGARVFVEIGPRNILTNLTQKILQNRPAVAVALDVPGRSSLLQFHQALAVLAAHGVSLQLERLYEGRDVKQLDLKNLLQETTAEPLPPTTWMVDCGKARPLHETGKPSSQSETSQKRATTKSQDGVKELPTNAAGQLLDSDLPKPEQGLPELSAGLPESDEDMTQVFLRHQQLMNKFLETQKQVMLAYLKGSQPGVTLPGASKLEQAETKQTPRPASQPTESNQTPVVPESDMEEQTHISTSDEKPTIDIAEQLLQIVSERTGYPKEILGLNMDMEADLGIDSIKRVEILGALQQICFPDEQDRAQEAMEELTKIKTLQGIIDWFKQAGHESGQSRNDETTKKKDQASQPVSIEGSKKQDQPLSRFLLKSVDAPQTENLLKITPGSLFIITDDEQGFARGLAEKLEDKGACIALLRMGAKGRAKKKNTFTADLTRATCIAEVLKRIQKQYKKPISGIIHLLPLQEHNTFEDTTFKDWHQYLNTEVKSLFHLVKEAHADLTAAANNGKTSILAATSEYSPGHGAIAGFVKTMALEWPNILCRVVNFDPKNQPSDLTTSLLQELVYEDQDVEIVYNDGARQILMPHVSPLNSTHSSDLQIDSNSVIVITGGGRGITAAVAIELAKRFKPKLILVGKSTWPEKEESRDTAQIADAAELKAALLKQKLQNGESLTPMQIESEFNQLLRARELRNNLAMIKKAGAKVEYIQVDVSDPQAFAKVIDKIYQNHGRIDGLIHGAGILEDKLILNKTSASFVRVFKTKVDSAFVLAKKLRPESLKFLVFFSSIAGRFGNRGQSDYAAANEVLDKLAVFLDQQWSARVVAINWGPWAKTGMVSEGVKKQFADRGVQLIAPEQGRQAFVNELLYGKKGEVEVILGEGPWERLENGITSDISLSLLNASAITNTDNSHSVDFILDPTRDPYLQHHQLDGKPVLPTAMAMELMAEIAKGIRPQWEVTGIRELQVLQGIILNKEYRKIRVLAKAQPELNDTDSRHEIQVEILEQDKSAASFRGIIELERQFSKTPIFERTELNSLQPFPVSVERAYRQFLFQGRCFQGIREIDGINEQGLSAILKPSFPIDLVKRPYGDCWLLDPVLLDSAFQMAILWQRNQQAMTPLPARIKTYRRFGVLPDSSSVRCYLHAKTNAGGHILLVDISFVDEQGRVFAQIEEMEFSCSRALNRLAETHSGGVE